MDRPCHSRTDLIGVVIADSCEGSQCHAWPPVDLNGACLPARSQRGVSAGELLIASDSVFVDSGTLW